MTQTASTPATAGKPAAAQPRGLPVVLVLATGALAWWGVWRGQYLFDDLPAIADNRDLCAGDWWRAAFAAEHHPLVNRPLSCLTLALDLALFGPGPFGPHLTNLLLHLVNGVLVLATVRAALLAPNLAGRFGPARATWLATAVAVLWVAHPLAGDAVAYATQRSTLLAAGFLLLALLASLRAAGSPRAFRWRALVVLSLACGMASKEDMVVAPLLVVLWERAFVLPSWAAVGRRAGHLAAMAASWLVLTGCLLLGPVNPTVGYATTPAVTAWQWLLTQAGVLVQYLRLVLWPQPLRGAYDWDIASGVGAAVLPGLAVLALVAVTAALWRSRPWWGFCGAWFFLLLAPTSSVLPIVTEIVAERRMYLPMLAVLVPVVVAAERALGARWAGRWWPAAALVAAVALVLGGVARQRVQVHADAASFWADAFAKRDPSRRSFLAAQILSNHGGELFRQGRVDEAIACFDAAMQCPYPTPIEEAQYASALQHRGRHREAVELLRRLAEERPGDGDMLGRFGTALVGHWSADDGRPDDPRLEQARAVLTRAVQLRPQHAGFWHALGFVLRVRGDYAAAAEAFTRSTEQTTARLEPYVSLAELLPLLGRAAEVSGVFERLLAANPDDVGLHCEVGEFLLAQHRPELALPVLQAALRTDPGNALAAELLRRAQSR